MYKLCLNDFTKYRIILQSNKISKYNIKVFLNFAKGISTYAPRSCQHSVYLFEKSNFKRSVFSSFLFVKGYNYCFPINASVLNKFLITTFLFISPPCTLLSSKSNYTQILHKFNQNHIQTLLI